MIREYSTAFARNFLGDAPRWYKRRLLPSSC